VLKFIDKALQKSDRYVNVIQKIIQVSKLRNSEKCARAITLQEMSDNIKDTIELNFKYRDYKTAFELIDQPYYQHLQPWVFEHWVKTLL